MCLFSKWFSWKKNSVCNMIVLLLIVLLGRTACCGFVFYERDLGEGDPCALSDNSTGQCQRISQCGKMFAERMNICGFVGIESIICCDVVRRQCNNIRPSLKRISDHVTGIASMADFGEFPFMALIKYATSKLNSVDEDFSHVRCGAVVVSKRFLLTAAHCIGNNSIYEPHSVVLGTNDANDVEADVYRIARVYKHERYARRRNDIGILELNEDIAFKEYIKPICIYTNPEDVSETVGLTVMGWGKTNDEEFSGMLLKGTVYPISRTHCQARYDMGITGRINLKDTHICALGDKNENDIATDTCSGDSGSPMILTEGHENYLVGLVSGGQGCGSEYYAGIYTRVNTFLPWIIKQGVFENV